MCRHAQRRQPSLNRGRQLEPSIEAARQLTSGARRKPSMYSCTAASTPKKTKASGVMGSPLFSSTSRTPSQSAQRILQRPDARGQLAQRAHAAVRRGGRPRAQAHAPRRLVLALTRKWCGRCSRQPHVPRQDALLPLAVVVLQVEAAVGPLRHHVAREPSAAERHAQLRLSKARLKRVSSRPV